jgi:aspartyl-tRNA(Asn)/glutamyl-tRNA(Gln) amidotransferase subunit A
MHASPTPAPGAIEARVAARLAAAGAPAAASVFTALHGEAAIAAARAADAAASAGAARGPLHGVVVTVKDLFDEAGHVTRAGSQRLEAAPAAAVDALAVARLKAAGAVVLGRTNMTEFAFSGVGLNPHFGTPANPSDPDLPRIPGGSSSGAAVSVALGLADAALGSDTGGSIRIPAALCGLVGFKNTQARTPLAGAFPLAPSLDTACAMSRSVAEAIALDAVLAGTAPLVDTSRPARGRLGGLVLRAPPNLVLEGAEPPVLAAFERALEALAAAGAHLDRRPMPALDAAAAVQQPYTLAGVEAFAVHREALADPAVRARFDPRVARRIEAAAAATAADIAALHSRRAAWRSQVEAALAGPGTFFVCPTVPMLAPPIAPLAADDALFFATNARLLRNPSLVNLWDGCAFSLPCHAAGERPVGLMLAAAHGADAALAALALEAEAVLAQAVAPPRAPAAPAARA